MVLNKRLRSDLYCPPRAGGGLLRPRSRRPLAGSPSSEPQGRHRLPDREAQRHFFRVLRGGPTVPGAGGFPQRG